MQTIQPKCFISPVLGILLALQPLGGASPQQVPTELNIVVVEGDGAINNIRQRTAREPIVQVEDENNRPVAGATVVFVLPESGPGGTFAGGARSLTVVTDQQGRAVAKGLIHNGQQGKFQIQVNASHQQLTATANISQANAVLTAASAGISGKMIAILAVVGGAIAGGVIAATSGGNGSNGGPTGPPVRPPTTITPGAPSFGGP